MKKFLSLVLALVMAMSLVTVSAGAKDFTDNSTITYDEAVDVISEIGVVDGYTDGSFNPTGNLTRGAAAKIICNLILGPTTAAALSADTAPYSDVPTSHEFSGYIAYCQQEGIISGYADGTFRPAAALTGYAFMKMLLGALDYDSEIEGYTGPNWSVNVAKRALGIGMDDGYVGTYVGTKALTREEACLFAFNTLQATLVEYESKITANVNGAEVTVGSSSAKPVQWATGSKNDGNIDDDGYVQFAEQYFDKLVLKPGTDDFARPSNIWEWKSNEVGTYPKEADATYTKKTEIGDIYKDLGLTKTIAKADVEVYVDGVENDDQVPMPIKKGDDDHKYGQNGVLTQVYFDEDEGTVTITEINTYAGQVSKNVAATSKKDAYVQIATLDKAPSKTGNLDFETEETFEEDAYIQFTFSEAVDEVKSVAVTESVNGTATKTVNKENNGDENKAITIGDTEYKCATKVSGELLSDVSVDNDYTIYLDQYGYVLYIEEEELTAQDYALVLDTANRGDFVGKKADLVFADGTTKVVTTEKDYSAGSKAIADYTIVSYKVDDDGVYTLKPVSTKQSDGITYNSTVKVGSLTDTYALNGDGSSTFKLENDKAGIVITKDTDDKAFTDATGAKVTTTVNANSKTVFVVRDTKDYDDYTSYTGIKNAPNIEAKTGADNQVNVYYYCKTGSMATVMFVFPGKNLLVEDDSNKLLYIANESASNLNHDSNSSYFVYNAVVNGEITTVKVDEDVIVNNAAGEGEKLNGLYKSFSTDKYGVITKVTTYPDYNGTSSDKSAVNAKTGVDKRSADYTVTLGTVGGPNIVVTVDDNATFFTVDKDGNISKSSYNSVVKDNDDLVYAAIKDYMVQTLIVETVDTTNDAKPATVTVTPETKTLDAGDKVTLSASVTLADKKYDEIVSYQWYKGEVKDENKVGTNSATYTVETAAADAGKTYTYTCVVTTYNDKVSGEDTATATSNTATVNVSAVTVPTVNLYVNKTGDGAANLTVEGAGKVAQNEAAKLTLSLTDNAYSTIVASINGVNYTVAYGTKTEVYVPVTTSDVVVTVSVAAPAAKTIASIKVTTLPTKTEYFTSEVFSDAGMVVTATYDNGTTATLAKGNEAGKYTVSAVDTAANGTKTVTVALYGSTTIKDTFEITVRAKNTTAQVSFTPTALSLAAGEKVTATVNVSNGGKAGVASVESASDGAAGGYITANKSDISATVVNGVLTVEVANGKTVEKGDSYVVEVACTTENGTAGTPGTITVTII